MATITGNTGPVAGEHQRRAVASATGGLDEFAGVLANSGLEGLADLSVDSGLDGFGGLMGDDLVSSGMDGLDSRKPSDLGDGLEGQMFAVTFDRVVNGGYGSQVSGSLIEYVDALEKRVSFLEARVLSYKNALKGCHPVKRIALFIYEPFQGAIQRCRHHDLASNTRIGAISQCLRFQYGKAVYMFSNGLLLSASQTLADLNSGNDCVVINLAFDNIFGALPEVVRDFSLAQLALGEESFVLNSVYIVEDYRSFASDPIIREKMTWNHFEGHSDRRVVCRKLSQQGFKTRIVRLKGTLTNVCVAHRGTQGYLCASTGARGFDNILEIILAEIEQEKIGLGGSGNKKGDGERNTTSRVFVRIHLPAERHLRSPGFRRGNPLPPADHIRPINYQFTMYSTFDVNDILCVLRHFVKRNFVLIHQGEIMRGDEFLSDLLRREGHWDYRAEEYDLDLNLNFTDRVEPFTQAVKVSLDVSRVKMFYPDQPSSVPITYIMHMEDKFGEIMRFLSSKFNQTIFLLYKDVMLNANQSLKDKFGTDVGDLVFDAVGENTFGMEEPFDTGANLLQNDCENIEKLIHVLFLQHGVSSEMYTPSLNVLIEKVTSLGINIGRIGAGATLDYLCDPLQYIGAELQTLHNMLPPDSNNDVIIFMKSIKQIIEPWIQNAVNVAKNLDKYWDEQKSLDKAVSIIDQWGIRENKIETSQEDLPSSSGSDSSDVKEVSVAQGETSSLLLEYLSFDVNKLEIILKAYTKVIMKSQFYLNLDSETRDYLIKKYTTDLSLLIPPSPTFVLGMKIPFGFGSKKDEFLEFVVFFVDLLIPTKGKKKNFTYKYLSELLLSLLVETKDRQMLPIWLYLYRVLVDCSGIIVFEKKWMCDGTFLSNPAMLSLCNKLNPISPSLETFIPRTFGSLKQNLLLAQKKVSVPVPDSKKEMLRRSVDIFNVARAGCSNCLNYSTLMENLSLYANEQLCLKNVSAKVKFPKVVGYFTQYLLAVGEVNQKVPKCGHTYSIETKEVKPFLEFYVSLISNPLEDGRNPLVERQIEEKKNRKNQKTGKFSLAYLKQTAAQRSKATQTKLRTAYQTFNPRTKIVVAVAFVVGLCAFLATAVYLWCKNKKTRVESFQQGAMGCLGDLLRMAHVVPFCMHIVGMFYDDESSKKQARDVSMGLRYGKETVFGVSAITGSIMEAIPAVLSVLPAGDGVELPVDINTKLVFEANSPFKDEDTSLSANIEAAKEAIMKKLNVGSDETDEESKKLINELSLSRFDRTPFLQTPTFNSIANQWFMDIDKFVVGIKKKEVERDVSFGECVAKQVHKVKSTLSKGRSSDLPLQKSFELGGFLETKQGQTIQGTRDLHKFSVTEQHQGLGFGQENGTEENIGEDLDALFGEPVEIIQPSIQQDSAINLAEAMSTERIPCEMVFPDWDAIVVDTVRQIETHHLVFKEGENRACALQRIAAFLVLFVANKAGRCSGQKLVDAINVELSNLVINKKARAIYTCEYVVFLIELANCVEIRSHGISEALVKFAKLPENTHVEVATQCDFVPRSKKLDIKTLIWQVMLLVVIFVFVWHVGKFVYTICNRMVDRLGGKLFSKKDKKMNEAKRVSFYIVSDPTLYDYYQWMGDINTSLSKPPVTVNVGDQFASGRWVLKEKSGEKNVRILDVGLNLEGNINEDILGGNFKIGTFIVPSLHAAVALSSAAVLAAKLYQKECRKARMKSKRKELFVHMEKIGLPDETQAALEVFLDDRASEGIDLLLAPLLGYTTAFTFIVGVHALYKSFTTKATAAEGRPRTAYEPENNYCDRCGENNHNAKDCKAPNSKVFCSICNKSEMADYKLWKKRGTCIHVVRHRVDDSMVPPEAQPQVLQRPIPIETFVGPDSNVLRKLKTMDSNGDAAPLQVYFVLQAYVDKVRKVTNADELDELVKNVEYFKKHAKLYYSNNTKEIDQVLSDLHSECTAQKQRFHMAKEANDAGVFSIPPNLQVPKLVEDSGVSKYTGLVSVSESFQYQSVPRINAVLELAPKSVDDVLVVEVGDFPSSSEPVVKVAESVKPESMLPNSHRFPLRGFDACVTTFYPDGGRAAHGLQSIGGMLANQHQKGITGFCDRFGKRYTVPFSKESTWQALKSCELMINRELALTNVAQITRSMCASPKVGEQVVIMTWNNGMTIPTISIGRVEKISKDISGHNIVHITNSTLVGDCSAIYWNNIGKIVALHVAGSKTYNVATPMVEEVQEEIFSSKNVLGPYVGADST